MKKPFLFLLLAFLSVNTSFSLQKDQVSNSIRLESPDKNLIFSFGIENNYPSYSVFYKGKSLIENSRLALVFKGTGEFGEDL
jgi:alpha-glucosidase